MSIRITHIHLQGGQGHEHITSYKWVGIESSDSGTSDKPTLVDWVDKSSNHAYVGQGSGRAEVGVVRPARGNPYLRTYADGEWTNNLLSLPQF